jgi:predicted transcriptional regulator
VGDIPKRAVEGRKYRFIYDLTDRDQRMLVELARHRFLSIEQLHYLLERGGRAESLREIRRRLQKLYHHRVVERPKAQLALWRKGRSPYVYTVGDEGAKVLDYAGDTIALGEAHWTKRSREGGDSHLAHTLMANTFLLSLARALAGSGVEISWQTELEWPPVDESGKRIRLYADGSYRNRETGRLTTYRRLPIRPDAVVTLRYEGPEGATRRTVFLEADQGNEAGRRSSLIGTSLFKKYLAYWRWYKDGSYREYLPGGFIVATVTTSDERARNLRAVAREADDKQVGSRMFWVTHERAYYDPDQPFRSQTRYRALGQPIWYVAKDPAESTTLRHLLENP